MTGSGSSTTNGTALYSGTFHVRFELERSARAAAREAGAAGFAVEIRDGGATGWLNVSRRKQPFPADDQRRYVGRLRTIAALHDGEYVGYVED
jgi:hypothetical protein